MRRAPPPDWLQRVFDEDDRQRSEFEAREWRREQQKSSAAPEIVHKTYDPNERRQMPQQRTATSMSPEQDRDFNDWWTARFHQALREVLKPAIVQFASEYVTIRLKKYNDEAMAPFARDFGEEVGKLEKQVKELQAELEKLQQQVGELRVDAEVERTAKVIDLPDFRKSANG